jgi:hypothetical protein
LREEKKWHAVSLFVRRRLSLDSVEIGETESREEAAVPPKMLRGCTTSGRVWKLAMIF